MSRELKPIPGYLRVGFALAVLAGFVGLVQGFPWCGASVGSPAGDCFAEMDGDLASALNLAGVDCEHFRPDPNVVLRLEVGPVPELPVYQPAALFPEGPVAEMEPLVVADVLAEGIGEVAALPAVTLAIPPHTAVDNPWPWSEDGTCNQHEDRYDWRKWVAGYDWPLEEVEFVIRVETGGTMDLCVVNRSSGAACWFQMLSGSDEAIQRGYLDPARCVGGAYAKWVDGGGGFERHWYRFWTK